MGNIHDVYERCRPGELCTGENSKLGRSFTQLCDFDRHKTVSILSLRHALLKESNIYRCIVSRNSRQHHRTHHRVTNQTNRAYKLSKYLNIYISHHRSPFTLPASRWEIPPTLLNNPITPNLSLPIPTPRR